MKDQGADLADTGAVASAIEPMEKYIPENHISGSLPAIQICQPRLQTHCLHPRTPFPTSGPPSTSLHSPFPSQPPWTPLWTPFLEPLAPPFPLDPPVGEVLCTSYACTSPVLLSPVARTPYYRTVQPSGCTPYSTVSLCRSLRPAAAQSRSLS